MTPTDEAHFIELWQHGLETAATAAAMAIPPGTARCRAYTLQQQGKIQPRPRGAGVGGDTLTTSARGHLHPRDHLHQHLRGWMRMRTEDIAAAAAEAFAVVEREDDSIYRTTVKITLGGESMLWACRAFILLVCAWILWSQSHLFTNKSSVLLSVSEYSWTLLEAYDTKEACERGRTNCDGAQRSLQKMGGTKEYVMAQCLPDTMKPQ
jgi:hypothetical protein